MFNMPVLDCSHVPAAFREPYIVKGYRRTDTSLWECFKYMFVLHNELGNIWTHFIPLLIWLYWLYCLSFQLDFTDPFWYPLLAIWMGGCSYAFCSSMAHGFGSKSIATRHICFMIDYQGISLYLLGGSIAFYFYERPVGSWLFGHKWCFIALFTALAINAALMSSLSRFHWRKQRLLVRIGFFTLSCVVGGTPFIGRLCSLQELSTLDTLPLHCCTYFTSSIALFFYASKFPERLKAAAGKFDYFLNSHQLFHIAAAMATSLQFHTLLIDAIARQTVLTKDPYYLPDIYSTLMPMLVMSLGGVCIVLLLGVPFFKRPSEANRSYM